MISALLVAWTSASGPLFAQPSDGAAQARRALGSYVYLMDSAGNKVLVATKFWRNDAGYDERAFQRYLAVIGRLEKRGFRQDEKAIIDTWDGKAPFARCFIYLEEPQAGSRAKGRSTTGSRVGCAESRISEQHVRSSDNPKHVDQVMRRVDRFLHLAKQHVAR